MRRKRISKKILFKELAFKLAVSRHNFDRRFIKATCNTPVEYLQRVKVEVAKSTREKVLKTIFELIDEVAMQMIKPLGRCLKK